jgi:TolB-like protein/Tfp pilus assembly protein PilF
MASFLAELRRRNVFKVAAAYAIVGWLLIQVATVFAPALSLPGWSVRLVAFLLILGFPVALILSWAYELTPEGVKRSKTVPLAHSITRVTGRKLDFAIIALLLLAVGFVFAKDYLQQEQTSADRGSDAAGTNASAPRASARNLRSIAALPFDNESEATENAEFFANGIHDELLTQLTKISSLKVISRTSVEEYRDTSKNMRQIGRELGVATLLEGRVQRAGDMVRINVQLINAETDEHMWADTYNRQLTVRNIFAMQSEIATEIAEALQAALSPAEAARIDRVPTDNTQAYDFYLSGRDYFTRVPDYDFMPTAVQQFKRAVEADPDFALAWAALARAHVVMYLYALDRTAQRLEMARRAVDKALELAPDAGESHLALAYFHYLGERDYPAALAELDTAERAMPGNSQIFEARAYVYRRAGDWERSVINMERAIQLDPRNTDVLFRQSGNYMFLREYARAEQYLDRILEIAPDDVPARSRKANIAMFGYGDASASSALAASGVTDPIRGWEAAIYERKYALALHYLDAWSGELANNQNEYIPKASFYGATYALSGEAELAGAQYMAARTELEDARRTMRDDARLYVSLAEALAALGEREAAARAAHHATELMPISADAMTGPFILYDTVRRVFAPMSDSDTALRELEVFLASPGFYSIEGILLDPRLDPIRDDPRFEALVDKYKRR